MKPYLFIIQIFLFSSTLAHAQLQFEENQIRSIDSLFNNWKSTKSPGGAAAIILDGDIIFRRAYGMADVEEKIPNDTTTVFNLASIVKQFVGICIALLEEQNLINENDELRKYYPDLQFTEGIKIKHLLNHTSGIKEAYVLLALSKKTNQKGKVKDEYNTVKYLYELLNEQPTLNFQPGDDFAYTNINFILLADIVENVSHQSIRDFADSALFKPLRMDQTVFQNYHEVMDNEAAGYTYTSPHEFNKDRVWNGVIDDLNLVSTINDLVKWEQNYFENKLGLKPDSLIKTITKESYLNDGLPVNYNYGLDHIEYRGIAGISHAGDNGRHTSIITRYPKFKLSIVCLANSGRYYDIQEKVDRISDILLEENIIEEKLPEEKDLKFITIEVDALTEKTGKYGMIRKDGGAEYVEINLHENKLYLTPIPDFKGFELKPISNNRFIAHNPEGEMIDLTFVKNDTGEFEIYQDFRNEKSVIKSLYKPKVTDFTIYAGKYQSETVRMSISVKADENEIFAKKGIIRIDLIPFGKDSFYAPDNGALFDFERKGKNEEVTALIINSSDFRNFKLIKK